MASIGINAQLILSSIVIEGSPLISHFVEDEIRCLRDLCYKVGVKLLVTLYTNSDFMPTVKLTTQQFKDDIFDYTQEKEWKYKGSKPAIIDFYADWCGPCKMVAPILEELSNENPDIVIYKVDTEVEQELSAVFQIRSIPSILFIPKDNRQPMMQPGALPKHALQEIIDKELVQTV